MFLGSQIIFWSSVFIVIYSYVIYPLVLSCLSRIFGTQTKKDEKYFPLLAVIVPAYNEELVIEKKIRNILSCDYPADRISVWVGSDYSTDSTNGIVEAIAKQDSRVHLWRSPKRCGKSEILNRLVPVVEADILLFTDANTIHRNDSLKKLVRNFSDLNVGGVAGNIEHLGNFPKELEEKMYRNFEVRQKQMESSLHSTISAFGGFYAIRRNLFKPIPFNAYSNDDVLIPMNIVRQGYRMIFEREAVSEEDMRESISEEFRRRVRIGAGNIQAFFWLLDFLNPLRGWPWFCYVSHKVTRWFSPLIILAGLITCVLLFFGSNNPVYQSAFYCLMTTLAIGLSYLFFPVRLNRFIFYFLTMNFALLVGFFRFLVGIRSAAWERTPRPK